MKKVLVTGANGFTGLHLVQELTGSQWQVLPMVQEKTGFQNEIVVDFCDPTFGQTLESLPPVDAVVHLAAMIGWYGGTRADLFQPNVYATAQLVQWAKKNGSKFVFASAALICGETNTHITAGCPMNTRNDYLYSKWLGEEIIKMSGIPHAILRISGIFGKNGPSHLGINKAIDAALNGTPPVQYGQCKGKRNYIYVKDLCQIIRFCLEQNITGTHLVGGPEPVAIAEMLNTICKHLLPGQTPEHRPGDPGRDQIIDHSPHLPKARPFQQAITDIAGILKGVPTPI